jgi:hypothetical protein
LSRIVIAALLLWSLASCQPLPHPLADDAPPPDAPIMTLKDSAGIVVAPVDGLPAPLAGQLAEALAGSLRESDVPASTATRNRGSYTLRSAAEEQPAADGRGTVVLKWQLLGPDGKLAGHQEQSVATDLPAWRAGDAAVLDALANSAAPSIAMLLQEDGATGVATGQRLVVPPIAGAPGDGAKTLADAMRNSLRHAGIEVAEGPVATEGNPLTLVGSVALGPIAAKQQDVTILWTLRNPDGKQIGEVKQQNRIPAGTLDGAWGDIAYVVASSATPGITAILDQLKLARTGP